MVHTNLCILPSWAPGVCINTRTHKQLTKAVSDFTPFRLANLVEIEGQNGNCVSVFFSCKEALGGRESERVKEDEKTLWQNVCWSLSCIDPLHWRWIDSSHIPAKAFLLGTQKEHRTLYKHSVKAGCLLGCVVSDFASARGHCQCSNTVRSANRWPSMGWLLLQRLENQRKCDDKWFELRHISDSREGRGSASHGKDIKAVEM